MLNAAQRNYGRRFHIQKSEQLAFLFHEILSCKKIDKFCKELVDLGQSEIIGIGRVQEYQWFTGRQQEILSH